MNTEFHDTLTIGPTQTIHLNNWIKQAAVKIKILHANIYLILPSFRKLDGNLLILNF